MPNPKTERSSFWKVVPWREATVRCRCHASHELFLPYERLSDQVKEEFTVNGPIPCEGGGMPGEWCVHCRFGEVDELEED